MEDRGGPIHVTARVKDDTVARALEEMRGDRYNRGTNAQFTWAGRSTYVKVGEVHVTTTTARSKMFRLELEIQEAPQDAMMEVSIGGKSPADLTELSLRSVLFGETNPLADQYMGFASQIADPLAPLREKLGVGGNNPSAFGITDNGTSGRHRAHAQRHSVPARRGDPGAPKPQHVTGSAQPLFQRAAGGSQHPG